MATAAQKALRHGDLFPYDDVDECSETPPPAKDWAHRAVRGILADLSDRCGIKWAFDDMEHEMRVELVEALGNIVREAHRVSQPGMNDPSLDA